MRVLITGGTGLLGVNWAAAMRDAHEIWLGTHRQRVSLRGVASLVLDLASPAVFTRSLGELRPDLIVHAAGLTSVDECERDPARAEALNVGTARTVAEVAAARSIRLAHISTDQLFAGDKPGCDEAEPPAPLNTYSRTKLAAERAVAALCPGALIVRTNFFGWGHALRKSFSDWILEALRAHRPLDMFTDAYFTPILADRLAKAVHALVEAGASGPCNVVGDERLSKHAFAMRLAAAFGLPPDGIRPAQLRSAKLAAPRPLDMSLSNARARRLLGGPLGGVDEQLAELCEQELSGRAGELRGAVQA